MRIGCRQPMLATVRLGLAVHRRRYRLGFQSISIRRHIILLPTRRCGYHALVVLGTQRVLVTRSIRNAAYSCLTSGSTRRVPRLGLGLLSTRLCGTRGLTWALGS